MDIALVIVFMLLGIAFFILEIFFLPGVSIGAVAGLLFVGGAVWYAFANIGVTAGWITIFFGVVAFAISIWLFLKFKVLERVSLKKEIDGVANQLENINVSVGDTGKTMTRMAPIGRVSIGGYEFEAKSDDGFLDKDTPIVVSEVDRHQIIIRESKQ